MTETSPLLRGDEARIRELVEFLCSRECLGRAPGTPGGRLARDRVQEEFVAAGLEPSAPGGEWLQAVPGCAGHNVVGRLPGKGERAIVVGAHYDHLGEAENGEAYWGADDNAAAVAVLVEVARLLRGRELERSVIFCGFDGEEPPHFCTAGMGSVHFVADPPVPLESIDAMVCMDLVGHALGPEGLPAAVADSLMVMGAGRGEGLGGAVDRAATRTPPGVIPRRMSCEMIPALSDYYAFDRAQIPFLFLSCGRWQHYHQVTDTPEKLAYPKIAATAGFLAELVVELADLEHERRYVPGGSDDAATVQSLRAVGEALEPIDARAKMLLLALKPFGSREKFSAIERQALAGIVSMVESTFGG